MCIKGTSFLIFIPPHCPFTFHQLVSLSVAGLSLRNRKKDIPAPQVPPGFLGGIKHLIKAAIPCPYRTTRLWAPPGFSLPWMWPGVGECVFLEYILDAHCTLLGNDVFVKETKSDLFVHRIS